MIIQHPRSNSTLFSNDGTSLEDHYSNGIMDARTSNRYPRKASHVSYVEAKKPDHWRRSSSQGHGKRVSRYFTSESLFLLVCLTVSLLILPLVLPPLPPPPLMLLLVPIFILLLLMVLAFMPCGVREVTHECG